MTTKLIRIGNSKGIILSKALIQHAHLKNEVTLDVSADGVLIRSAKSLKRKDWDKKFRRAKKNVKQNKLLLGSWGNEFDKSEWEWK
ncbi:MAG: hypothetical protein ABIQ74_11480 [Chitinophagales bacterium]